MAEMHPSDRGLTRRRFLATSGALGVGAAIAGAVTWPAAGQPGAQANCGDPNDQGEIWNTVKNAQPGQKGIEEVVLPPNGDRAFGHAILTGGPKYGPWDWLCVPLIRVSGIECEKCWSRSAMLNLWQPAAAWVNDPRSKLAGEDWALGINSGDPGARTQNQMHIHVTKLDSGVRRALNDAVKNKNPVPAESFGDWPNKTIELANRQWRWMHTGTLDHHLFIDVFENIAQRNPAEMAHQTIGVTAAHGVGGFYIFSSQHQLKGGTMSVDSLLHRGG